MIIDIIRKFEDNHYNFDGSSFPRERVYRTKVEPSQQIYEIRAAFGAKYSALLNFLPFAFDIQLSIPGRNLDDDKTLDYYGIKEGSIVVLEVVEIFPADCTDEGDQVTAESNENKSERNAPIVSYNSKINSKCDFA